MVSLMSTNFSTAGNNTGRPSSLVDILLNLSGVDYVLLAWITGIVMLVMEAFIVIGNGLVIVAIVLDPLKTIRRCPSNHLVLSLAVADFLVGVVICFFSGWWNIGVAAYKEDLFNAAESSSSSRFDLVAISTTNLLALGVDRLIAIKSPMQYAYKVTLRNVRVVIVCIWVYFSVLASSLPIFLKSFSDFVFNCHSTIAFLALVIICEFVIHFLRKQTTAMKKCSGSSRVLRNVVERERKVTRGVIVLTLVFIACFVPFFIYQLLEFFCSICWENVAAFLLIFRNIALMLVCFNSLVNPYLYALRLPKYSETFKHLAKKLFICRKARVFPLESVTSAQRETHPMSLEQT